MLPLALIMLCSAAATAPATAAPPASLTDAELEAFHKSYADHRLTTAGWSGNFHQEARSPDLLAPILSDGNLTYRAPATLEMNYTTPFAGQVRIQNNDVGQEFSGRAPQAAAMPMMRSLLDFFRLPPAAWQKDFVVTAERDHGLVRIQLAVKPAARARQPNRILVEVHPLTFDPLRLEIIFAEKASLTFVFTDWKSLGPPSAIAPEPPAHEPTPAPSRTRFPPGK